MKWNLMSSKSGVLLLGVLIALICIPAVVNAADPYIEVKLTDPAQYTYRSLTIETVKILDPLDPQAIEIKLNETAPSKILRLPSVGEVNGAFDPAEGPYSHGGNSVYVTTSPLGTSNLPEVYQNYLIYTEQTFPDFKVTGPDSVGFGNVLLLKCPENLDPNAGFTELFKDSFKEGYLFNKTGMLYFKYDSSSKTGANYGGLFYDENDLASTLERNVVELNYFCPPLELVKAFSPGGDHANFGPEPGEYIITVVQYDSASKTMQVLAAMPVLILDGNPTVTWNGDNPYYQSQNKGATVSFDNVDKIAYALVKENSDYGLSMQVDTKKLAETSIPTSIIDAISILKASAGKESPVTYILTADGAEVDLDVNSQFVIAKGYGCSGYADASSVTIAAADLKALNPGTYSLYALGMNGQKVVAVDQKEVVIKAKPSGGGGGGGGSPSGVGPSGPTEPSGPVAYEGTGSLMTDSTGIVVQSIAVSAVDGVATVIVPAGVQALDANGNPLTEVGIEPLASDAVPAVPAGAVFAFAGYAYVASPAGATFDPAITLTMQIPEDVWNTLDLESEQLSVKWYNEETGLWEDVPTTFDPETRTVRATVTHFSIFALFTEPIEATVTPIETPTTTTTTTAPGGETPTEGLPVTMILGIFVVVIIIAAAGYFLLKRK